MKNRLQAEPGDRQWVLLRNLTFSVTPQRQSDEIDLVVIGPPGVRLVEVKHWTAKWAQAESREVEQEAERVTYKARKLGTTLRKRWRALPRVDGVILLTEEASKVEGLAGQIVAGVKFFTLNDWKRALDVEGSCALSPNEVSRLAHFLRPQSGIAIDGSLRRLAGYVNLELLTPKTERFHRVYRGAHPARRDRVVLHLFDLSASDDRNAQARARREFESLQRLQLCAWAPRILDSFQPVPGYAGEMFFFTVADPAAPTLQDRSSDDTWDTLSRVEFARNAVRALRDLHREGIREGIREGMLHRNITSRTILVKYDNTAVFTGFERARIPEETSVASRELPPPHDTTVAPEVRLCGFGAADHRSDVYSLCACMARLFEDGCDANSLEAANIFARGLATEPEDRATLDALDSQLGALLGESLPPPPPPPARFWTEDQVIRFRDNDYRVVTRLGSGGVGMTFKVLHINRSTGEELGTYVAKVAKDGETGKRVLRAYSLARSHLRHTALSTIFEVAKEWQENQFIALMTWVSGTPLNEFIGVFPLLAEEQQEASSEELAIRWLGVLCEALDVLHRNGLIHGDVSPRNLIVSGADIVLTDYDFVGRVGERPASPGTLWYCSPEREQGGGALPSDDLYALAASFFHVVFDRQPFRYGDETDKRRGLNWEGVPREHFPILAPWLDRATHSDVHLRFASAKEARQALLRPLEGKFSEAKESPDAQATVPTMPPAAQIMQASCRPERVPWLEWLLQSYPGSRWGNRETRGLDSDFAGKTYVETRLEANLLDDIRTRRGRLVILCGNAGDGKTALLQHLARRLGLGQHPSSERLVEGRLPDGLLVRINLDGSASWQGQSADRILDAFLAPFQNGPPAEDVAHLLAINDGRLLEWLATVESREGRETLLTGALYCSLEPGGSPEGISYLRFISLNQRSLVGGIDEGQHTIDTSFLVRLIDQLYGGSEAPKIWAPCQSCSAKERCEVFRATRLFGPASLPVLEKHEVRERARQRLFEALQAVHLRAETHITMRELRAALVFILFGIHYCDDYHSDQPVESVPYWDRAFRADVLGRQGEVLAELVHFDPGLEAHPQIDRHLQSKAFADPGATAPRYPNLALQSARRRAFFEWTTSDIIQVSGDPAALGLAGGRHLQVFRDLPLDIDGTTRAQVCERICAGISRLEDLPPRALSEPGIVPLRITPRTPTETAFWVEKRLAAFRLEVDLPPPLEGMERLHRRIFLVYRYRSGKEERLALGADLFRLLMELAEGYQLGDVSTDDTFAHLSIFVQRLTREDERELVAWNPMEDDTLFRIRPADGSVQRIVISPIIPGGVE